MIIDTHTHFYDPSRKGGVPWPNPEDPVLYRTVLPPSFLNVAQPVGVTKTVVVEASEWVEDNDWILRIAASEPCIAGFVGNLNPAGGEFRKHLDRLSGSPLFRGIRIRGIGLEEAVAGAGMDNLRYLTEKSLSLDVLVGPNELGCLDRLVRRLPGLTVVINHIAHVPVDGKAPDARWRDGMRTLAECPRVYCQVSGLVEATAQSPALADPSFYRPVLDVLWNTFGEKQLLYASNWPVCEKAAEYATVFNIADTFFKELGDCAFRRVFRENAIAAYRLPQDRL